MLPKKFIRISLEALSDLLSSEALDLSRHENAGLRHENAGLRHENIDLSDENEVLRHERAASKHENTGLRRENADLSYGNTGLRYENAALSDENAFFRNRAVADMAQVSNFQSSAEQHVLSPLSFGGNFPSNEYAITTSNRGKNKQNTPPNFALPFSSFHFTAQVSPDTDVTQPTQSIPIRLTHTRTTSPRPVSQFNTSPPLLKFFLKDERADESEATDPNPTKKRRLEKASSDPRPAKKRQLETTNSNPHLTSFPAETPPSEALKPTLQANELESREMVPTLQGGSDTKTNLPHPSGKENQQRDAAANLSFFCSNCKKQPAIITPPARPTLEDLAKVAREELLAENFAKSLS